MADETRTERATADLDRLRNERDPEGQKTYLTVYADLSAGDWMQRLKDRAEAFRYTLSSEEATGANVHRAFDQAFVAAERLADKGAKAAAIVVSPVHDVAVAEPLDHEVETELILDDRPVLDRVQ